jgi:hypothetical protein
MKVYSRNWTTNFWHTTTSYSLLTVNQRFGRTSHLHFQGWRAWTAYCLLHASFLLGILFNPEDGGDMFLRNVGWFSTDYIAIYPRTLENKTFGMRIPVASKPYINICAQLQWLWLTHILAAVGSKFPNILRCSLLVPGKGTNITLVLTRVDPANNEWRCSYRTLQLSIRIRKIQN